MKKIIISLCAAFFLCLLSVTKVRAAEGIAVDKKDGDYKIEVSMEGGSGRASITSPADMIVKDGKAYVRLEWSSPNYDYMLIENEKYLPVNEEGNSVFEIPILAFDEPMNVTADTTAMSVPHEIDYQLVFDEASITTETSSGNIKVICFIGAAFLLCLLLCILSFLVKKKRWWS